MIVNGRTALVGSRRGEVDAAIARAGSPVGPTLRLNGNAVEVGMRVEQHLLALARILAPDP